ncbi:MAG: hypothetical protein N3A01_07935 [Bacteroidales bacterium]|nr:hypothetical protein [Bacteroidales bacterium]
MNKSLLCSLLLITTFNVIQSQTLLINNESYSNDEIFFIKYKDQLTFLTDTIKTSRFSADGYLKANLSLSEVEKLIIPLYYYEAHIFVEPIKEYELIIPDKKYLSVEDSLNPYFTAKVIYPLVKNNKLSLQNCISAFEDDYYKFIALNYAQLKYKTQRSKVDSLCNILLNKYSNCNSTYFNEYTFYKIAQLKYLTYERNINYIIKNYFNDKKILYNNYAYWEFFNDIFSDYFLLISNEKWAQDINLIINKTKSHTELKRMFKNNPAFTNDTLIEIVILKALHDVFFHNKYKAKDYNLSKNAISIILDSLKNFGLNDHIKTYARNIIQKIKINNLNDFIYDLPIYSLNNETYYLRNFLGNNIYLAIYDFRAYNFLTDMKQIKAFLGNLENKIKIIILVVNCKKEKLIKLIEKEKLVGNFFLVNNINNLKNKFNIIIPSYFFIHANGKVEKNIVLPDENFKRRLLKIIGE